MRRILVFVVSLFLSTCCIGQTVYIPDSGFRWYLQSNYPNCMDGDNLDTQCAGVVNEDTLDIGILGISDLTGVEHFVGLTFLRVNHNDLTSLPELPSTINFLAVTHNNLTSLPSLPEGLIVLNCGVNQITELPPLPASLQNLHCDINQITQLPSLPSALRDLTFPENEVSQISSLPTGIQRIVCHSNGLTSLPTLPLSLEVLDCDENLLTELPVLPSSLLELKVNSNGLNSLPPLPNGLLELEVDNNNFTAIQNLPMGLQRLHCSGNDLTSLPELPSELQWLECNHNNLTGLPSLPANIVAVVAESNEIMCLPILPESLYGLGIAGNEDLNCLPNLPENFGEFLTMNQHAWTLPICSPNNVYGCPALHQVSGKVFFDENNDCLDQGEVGLANRMVETSNGRFALSDSNGYYELFLDTGTYTIWQHLSNGLWEIDCNGLPYTLSISGSADSIVDIDFPNQALESCHWLWVDVASTNHRPCFSNNICSVSFCNNGTESVQDAYVEVSFPDQVVPLQSSIPWQLLSGGTYRFEIGDLDIGECGSFSITDSVSCDATLGSTVCFKAEIFPTSPCLIATTQPGWDNSSLAVTGSCSGASIDFSVKNVGTGNMTSPSTYRLYKDNMILLGGQVDELAVGASTTISQLAHGETYRLEVDQSLGHPGTSLPRATVEGCGSPVSLGQVLVAQQDDIDDNVEVSCIELSASYDPNDKRVVPAGFGSQHIVHPDYSLLEYTVRFQNTGTDTAFTVVVVDTLPSVEVNPATFLSGASSHPYSVNMHDNGIVTWRFENILLPDSATNEPASNGFVKFKISTRPGLPNGTVINNRANIYFDFNDPIITGTCFITISDIPIVASIGEIESKKEIRVYPNPTARVLNIDIPTSCSLPTSISILDMTGRKVLESAFSPQIDVSRLRRGNYVLELISDMKLFRNKLIVE